MSNTHIFLREDKNPNGPGVSLLLANFGNSKVQDMNQSTRSTFTISDEYYMTPENIELINATMDKDKDGKPIKKEDSEKAAIKPGK